MDPPPIVRSEYSRLESIGLPETCLDPGARVRDLVDPTRIGLGPNDRVQGIMGNDQGGLGGPATEATGGVIRQSTRGRETSDEVPPGSHPPSVPRRTCSPGPRGGRLAGPIHWARMPDGPGRDGSRVCMPMSAGLVLVRTGEPLG